MVNAGATVHPTNVQSPRLLLVEENSWKVVLGKVYPKTGRVAIQTFAQLPSVRELVSGGVFLCFGLMMPYLRLLAVPEIFAQDHIPNGLSVVPRQRKPHWRAGIVVPNLNSAVYPVPVRKARLSLQQIVNARAALVAEFLDKVALLRVRGQA